jgi:hypothetical protein
MWVLVSGILLLGAILGTFWLKDHLRSPFLLRVAYHEVTARLALISAALIVIGLLLTGGDILEMLGLL